MMRRREVYGQPRLFDDYGCPTPEARVPIKSLPEVTVISGSLEAGEAEYGFGTIRLKCHAEKTEDGIDVVVDDMGGERSVRVLSFSLQKPDEFEETLLRQRGIDPNQTSSMMLSVGAGGMDSDRDTLLLTIIDVAAKSIGRPILMAYFEEDKPDNRPDFSRALGFRERYRMRSRLGDEGDKVMFVLE